MKTPLSPAEVHRQYEEALSAFVKSLPDATLRVRLSGEADDFFRACALGVWQADGVTITTDVGVDKTIPCDSVVEFYDMVPNTGLAEELESAGFEVHTVGDAAEPYNIQRAVRTGNLCARSL